MTQSSCCSPDRDGQRITPLTRSEKHGLHDGILCDIPGGNSVIGTNNPLIKQDGEAPLRKTKIKLSNHIPSPEEEEEEKEEKEKEREKKNAKKRKRDDEDPPYHVDACACVVFITLPALKCAIANVCG